MTPRTCVIWLTLAGLTLTLASASSAIAQPNPRPLWQRFPLNDTTRSTPRNGTPPSGTAATLPQPQSSAPPTVPDRAPAGSPSDEPSSSGLTTTMILLAALAIAALVNLLFLLLVRQRWIGQRGWTVHGAAARAAAMVPGSQSLPRRHLPRPSIAGVHLSALGRRPVV